MRKYLILCLGLLVGPMAAATAADTEVASGERSLPFETAPVEVQKVAYERVLNGTVDAVNQTTVSAETSGTVSAIHYDVDDFVKQGDIILRLKAVRQKAGLKAANANVAEARARLSEARQEYARVKDVFERQLVSKSKLDKATASLRAAEARLEAALAARSKATEQAENTVVRAPYSGIVKIRHVELGEFVNVGQKLMTGVSLEKLRVNVDVPQRLINQIRTHKKARVLLDGRNAKSIPVKDLTFFPYADPVSNTFKVRANLAEGVEGLFPGMFVKVAFVTGEKEQLVVPAQAVVYRSEVTGVYVVDEAGTIVFRQVRLGKTTADGKVVILAGLSAGEKVALDHVKAAVYLKKQRAAAAGAGKHD
jgi:RND family efflux transporter MFP subunit